MSKRARQLDEGLGERGQERQLLLTGSGGFGEGERRLRCAGQDEREAGERLEEGRRAQHECSCERGRGVLNELRRVG
jgi:hypothetical protein